MGKTLKIFALITGIVAGITIGLWTYGVYQLKHEITNLALKDNEHFSLEYKDISYKGFPFYPTVTLKNPILTEKTLNKSKTQLTVDGDVSIGVSLLGTHGWLEIIGTSIIGTTNRDSDAVLISGSMRYEIDDIRNSFLALSALVQKNEKTKSNIELFYGQHFIGEEISCRLSSSDNPFFEAEHMELNFNKIQENATYSTAGRLELAFLQYHWSFEELSKHNMQMQSVASLLKEINQGKDNFILSAQMHFSFAEDGAMSAANFDSVELRTKNDVLEFNYNGTLSVEKLKESFIDVSMAIKLACKTSDKWDSQTPITQKKTIELYRYLGLFTYFPRLENLLGNHWEKFSEFTSKYRSSKPVTAEIVVQTQVPADSKNINHPKEVTGFCKLAYQVDPYEIDLSVHFTPSSTSNCEHFEITISNYQQLTDQFVVFYNDLRDLLVSTQTVGEVEMPYVNKNVTDKIVRFLETLSTSTKANVLQVVVKQNSDGTVSYGNMNQLEYLASLGQFIAEIQPELFPNTSYQNGSSPNAAITTSP